MRNTIFRGILPDVRVAILLLIAFSLGGIAEARGFGKAAKPVPYEMGEDIFKPRFWVKKRVDFVAEHATNGFRYVGRYSGVKCTYPDTITFFGTPVREVHMTFGEKYLERLQLHFYCKGDAETTNKMTKAILEERLPKIVAALDKAAVCAGKPAAHTPPIKSSTLKGDEMGKAYRMVWDEGMPVSELSWGITGKKGAETIEYFTLTQSYHELSPPPKHRKGRRKKNL